MNFSFLFCNQVCIQPCAWNRSKTLKGDQTITLNQTTAINVTWWDELKSGNNKQSWTESLNRSARAFRWQMVSSGEKTPNHYLRSRRFHVARVAGTLTDIYPKGVTDMTKRLNCVFCVSSWSGHSVKYERYTDEDANSSGSWTVIRTHDVTITPRTLLTACLKAG